MELSHIDQKNAEHGSKNVQIPKSSSASASVSTEGSEPKQQGSAAAHPTRKSTAKKRVIDETKLSVEEAEKLQTRRAYNRECASRARKRTKEMLAQLQGEVKELQEDKSELRRANSVMKAQMEMLEKQNQTLLVRLAMAEQSAVSAMSSTRATGLPFHPGQLPMSTAFPALGLGLGTGPMPPGLLPASNEELRARVAQHSSQGQEAPNR